MADSEQTNTGLKRRRLKSTRVPKRCDICARRHKKCNHLQAAATPSRPHTGPLRADSVLQTSSEAENRHNDHDLLTGAATKSVVEDAGTNAPETPARGPEFTHQSGASPGPNAHPGTLLPSHPRPGLVKQNPQTATSRSTHHPTASRAQNDTEWIPPSRYHFPTDITHQQNISVADYLITHISDPNISLTTLWTILDNPAYFNNRHCSSWALTKAFDVAGAKFEMQLRTLLISMSERATIVPNFRSTRTLKEYEQIIREVARDSHPDGNVGKFKLLRRDALKHIGRLVENRRLIESDIARLKEDVAAAQKRE